MNVKVMDTSSHNAQIHSRNKQGLMPQLGVKMNLRGGEEYDKGTKEVAFCGTCWLEPSNSASETQCTDNTEGIYLSLTSIVDLDEKLQEDAEIDEDEAQKAYKTLYNKCFEVVEKNKELEQQMIVLTKEI